MFELDPGVEDGIEACALGDVTDDGVPDLAVYHRMRGKVELRSGPKFVPFATTKLP